MKVHKAMNVYKGVDAFITPSEFLKKKLIENGFDENKITCIPTFTASKSEVGTTGWNIWFVFWTCDRGKKVLILSSKHMR